MYEVVVHKRVAKNIKHIPKSHLQKLSSLLEVLKRDQVPYRDFDLKKIGSLVSRVAVTNTYKEIAYLSKSLHFGSRCLPEILSGYVSFYHELVRLDE